MGYRVGHWSHYSECFACFPHGWVDTLTDAVLAAGVAGEDIPLVESHHDIEPQRIAREEARLALNGALAIVELLDGKHIATMDAAHAWAAAAREPHHGRRLVLLRSADALGPPLLWTATERLARAVRAVTALP